VAERALAYVRVSTLKQEKDGKNLHGQLAEIQNYCRQRGYALEGGLETDEKKWTRGTGDVFADIVSGGRMDRQGFFELVSRMASGKASVIVAYDVSRFGRNTMDNGWLLIQAQEFGLRVETVTGGRDFLENPEAELSYDVMSVVAKYFRKSLQAQLLRGKRTHLREGRWVGGPCAYGYRVTGQQGNKHLAAVPEEIAVVRSIYERYERGENLTRIAASLKGVICANPARVSHLLKNPVYAGYVHFNGQVVKGTHEAAVPLETWERVKALMAERASRCNLLKPTVKKRGRPRIFPPQRVSSVPNSNGAAP
jgi:DNA invertase Pin-like site-specific DNA recombinase